MITQRLIELSRLFISAQDATNKLRMWVLQHYDLHRSDLDPSLGKNIANLNSVKEHDLFLGYKINHAPNKIKFPICKYIIELKKEICSEKSNKVTIKLINLHNKIIVLSRKSDL